MDGIKKVDNKNFESLEDFLDGVMDELEQYMTWLNENNPDSKQEIVTQRVYDMLNSVNTNAIYEIYKISNSDLFATIESS